MKRNITYVPELYKIFDEILGMSCMSHPRQLIFLNMECSMNLLQPPLGLTQISAPAEPIRLNMECSMNLLQPPLGLTQISAPAEQVTTLGVLCCFALFDLVPSFSLLLSHYYVHHRCTMYIHAVHEEPGLHKFSKVVTICSKTRKIYTVP